MKTSNKLYWILGAVCALNFAGHLVCYPFLPEQVPVPVSYTHLTLPTNLRV